ncbi:extracellular elastinolytic metalloproteinase [Colletotrichum sojae]|uniref:Extracellular metalloproteinase n=1 Tax=Colletotrichum sojae TaxID=2175907 RepID=A0A8H6IWN5_9PEZI|nr:extracellular elastinolytic metalloproteinase [Colletotrichum sojae]
MYRSMKSLALLGLLAPAFAHPASSHNSALAHRRVDIEAFRLPQLGSYTNATQTETNPPIALLKRETYVDTATGLVKKLAPSAEFRVVGDHYVGTNGVGHVNFKQTIHGLDVDNGDFNVNIGKDGKVFSFGNNFFTGEIPAVSPLTKRDFKDPVAGFRGAKEILELPVEANNPSAEAKEGTEVYAIKGTSGAVSDPEAKLVYFVKGDGSLALTWRVETDIVPNWLLTYVDAENAGEVHGVVDYTSDLADYRVYPWGVNDPAEGERILATDPWDINASEFAWHSDGPGSNYTTTRGNNGIAQSNPSGGSAYLNNYRPNSPSFNFDYEYSTSLSTPSSYIDASITQLFYTANHYHDLLYQLGFNEAAGNFQANNGGNGGIGNDFVVLNAQDGSGTNNAMFSSPSDGRPGRMYMYMWTRSTPRRDCSFEAGVVIHEYTHGVSNRLTGGPANAGCLSALESGGMGEGWGDFMATAIRLKPTDTRATDYSMGAWVANNPVGIRSVLYSTSLTTNPNTYSTINGVSSVHRIGETWATILYEVLWNLIDKHGKNDGPWPEFRDGVPTDGKYLTLKLVLDGMALQPCSPNFIQARDAILDADKALTGGDNQCELWTAFAKRGLGSDAVYSSSNRRNGFTIPTGVC